MRSTLLTSRALLSLACSALLMGSTSQTLWASVCHDGNWDSGEFCGRDAFVVTGSTEMNHDCSVDFLDLRLLREDFGKFGPNLSADFDDNGTVNIMDIFPMRLHWGDSVSPCSRSGMLPDQCDDTIALSFESDPATIVSTQTQSPGSGTVYVVIDGWANAEVLEYAVETSSNIEIVAHNVNSLPFWRFASDLACDPDLQHSYKLWLTSGGWPVGPIAFAYVDYELLDSNPAWIKLVSSLACAGGINRIRWGEAAANRSIDFKTVLNAGINGPAPAGQTTCGPLSLPVLAPHMIWLLTALLLAPAVLFLGRRSLRRQRPAVADLVRRTTPTP